MNPPLNELDDLDKRIVVALQQDGRASWRTIAETVDGPVTTVVRRGQQLLADGVVKVTAVPALGAFGEYDNFLVRMTCAPGRQAEVAARLVARPDVRFCTIVTGEFDIIAELVVHGGANRYVDQLGSLQDGGGIERSRSDLIMHLYKVSHEWGRQLGQALASPDGIAPAGVPLITEPEPCDPSHLDAADWAILERLRLDGRDTFQNVARAVGLNESSVRRRFERLRARHCLGVVTLVSSAALRMGAETLITVRVAPSRLETVARQLAAHPSVRYLAALLDDNSLLCEVITPTSVELYAFIQGTLAVLDGVEGWTASMELVYLKRGSVETPWWRAQLGIA